MITAKSAGSAHKWSSENGNFGCKPDLMAQFKEKYASPGNFFYIFIPPYALYHSHIMITAKSAGSAHKWSSENGNFGCKPDLLGSWGLPKSISKREKCF